MERKTTASTGVLGMAASFSSSTTAAAGGASPSRRSTTTKTSRRSVTGRNQHPKQRTAAAEPERRGASTSATEEERCSNEENRTSADNNNRRRRRFSDRFRSISASRRRPSKTRRPAPLLDVLSGTAAATASSTAAARTGNNKPTTSTTKTTTPLRSRMPALVTPSSSDGGGNGGGGGSFFRRVVSSPRKKKQRGEKKKYGGTCDDDDDGNVGCVLGIQASSPFKDRARVYRGDGDDDYDDDDELLDLLPDGYGPVGDTDPSSVTMSSSGVGSSVHNFDGIAGAPAEEQEEDEEEEMCFDEEEADDGLVDGGDHLLGIGRPSYQSPGSDNNGNTPSRMRATIRREQNEIVFEEVRSDIRETRSPSLFEQSWLSGPTASSDQEIVTATERITEKPTEEEEDDDGDEKKEEHQSDDRSASAGPKPLYFADQITCTSAGIEMTYQGAAPSSPGASPSSLPESPEKLVHKPTAAAVQRTETKKKGVRYFVGKGIKATAAAAARASTPTRRGEQPSHGVWARKTSPLASPHTTKIFVLLLQPDSKIFELIQLVYPTGKTTVGDILDMIPKNATEPVLASLKYVAITRPKKRSPDYSDRTLLASAPGTTLSHYATLGASPMGTTAAGATSPKPNVGLVAGEIILAITEGYAHYDIVKLGKKILANSQIQKVLDESNPLGVPKKKRSKSKKKHKRTTRENKIVLSSNTSARSVHTMERVEEEEHDEEYDSGSGSSSYATALRDGQSAVLAAAKGKRKTPSPHSKPGSLDAYLSDPISHERVKMSSKAWSPGSAATSSLIDAYLSDSSSRRRRRNVRQQHQQQKRNNSFDSGCPQPAAPTVLDAYLSSPSRNSRRDRSAKGSGSVSSIQDDRTSFHSCCSASMEGRQRLSIHQGRNVDSYSGKWTAPHDTISLDDDGSLSTTWSNSAVDFDARHRDASSSSFVSLTSPRLRCSVASSSSTPSSSFTIRRKQLRNKKLFVGFAKIAAALLATMVVRYYLDPSGYAAARSHSVHDSDTTNRYNRPMGVLGCVQLFLAFQLLVKFQRTMEERP